MRAVGNAQRDICSDCGNDRTVDSICEYQIKTVKDGETVLLDNGYMDLEYAYRAMEIYTDYLAENGLGTNY